MNDLAQITAGCIDGWALSIQYDTLQFPAGTGVTDCAGRTNGEKENQQVCHNKSNIAGSEQEIEFQDPGQRKHNEPQPAGSRNDSVDVKSSLRPCDFPPAVDKLRKYACWNNTGNCRAEPSHIRTILVCAAVGLKEARPEIEKKKYHGKEEAEGPEVDEYGNENNEKWDGQDKIEPLSSIGQTGHIRFDFSGHLHTSISGDLIQSGRLFPTH
jgi:hypothetical protein